MPHRRPVSKGSFGGRIDQLVEHFPDELAKPDPERTRPGSPNEDARHINERLFEGSWRKAHQLRRSPTEQP